MLVFQREPVKKKRYRTEQTVAALKKAEMGMAVSDLIRQLKQVLKGEVFREARFLINNGMSVADVAAHLGIGRSTLYRYLQAA